MLVSKNRSTRCALAGSKQRFASPTCGELSVLCESVAGLLDRSHVLEGAPAVASGASDVRDANAAHSDPERDTPDA